jgi:cytochrome b-561
MAKGSGSDSDSAQALTRWYYFIAIFAQVVGVIGVILVGVDFGVYFGGFTWGGSTLFNYHPLFMTLGMVFLYGDGLLIYRIFRNSGRLFVKLLHGFLLLASLIFASVGLAAVFQSYDTTGGTNLGSLHSWFGLTAVILFGLQWVCGFFAFLFPKVNHNLGHKYMPMHKYWGRTIFTLVIVTALMGIAQYGVIKKLYSTSTLLAQRNILSVAGIMLLVFAFCVLYLIGERDFERPEENREEHVPLTE